MISSSQISLPTQHTTNTRDEYSCSQAGFEPEIPVIERPQNYTLDRTAITFIQYIIHHHHISVVELGHMLTRSDLTYPEVSSNVCHDSFCHLGSSVSLPWVIYYETFYLHVINSFSCITIICPKLVLFLTPLQFVYLFCNLSEGILLLFSCVSSLLLLFFWRPLL